MNRVYVSFAAAVCLAATGCAKKITNTVSPAAAAVVEVATPGGLRNASDSFCFAAGVNIAYNLREQGVKELNADIIAKAMEMVFNNDSTLNMSREESLSVLQEKLKQFADEKAAAAKEKSAKFLEENKKKPGVTALPNGLQYEVLNAGPAGGMMPKASDTVVVHYVGTLTDGTEFDNSVKRGEPATFPLNGVIRGWTEILQLMPKGSKWKVVIPSDLAYGDRGAGGVIAPNSTLIFDIELLDIKPSVNQ